MDAFVRRLPKVGATSSTVSASSGPREIEGRPAKRRKTDEVQDSASEDSDAAESEVEKPTKLTSTDGDGYGDGRTHKERHTEFEDALPPTQDEEAAIIEYEFMKSSQAENAEDDTTDKTRPLWIRGRSSIYVDAFNLALDIVLEQEEHLFDTKEGDVFRQWRELDYEAQYLYVRLFLRKTDAWHRQGRLSYQSDIADLEGAISKLQAVRPLPESDFIDDLDVLPGVDITEGSLGRTFAFADASEDHLKTVEEAAPLLGLDELKGVAKAAKVQGRNKAEIIRALCRTSQRQIGLMSMGLSRQNSRDSAETEEAEGQQVKPPSKLGREDSNREQHFLGKVTAILGPCIRLSHLPFRLFERVHLVFYRSTEWTEKSLTTIILAKIARRTFPEYIVCRTNNIFGTRMDLLEFEAAIKLEAEVDHILEFNEPPGDPGYQRVLELFENIYPRWQKLVMEEGEKEKSYDMGEGAYLRRFTPAHSYTRIIHKALGVLARYKKHKREHGILTELLDQRLFHLGRRGSWYQRKALLEEHYMPTLDENPVSADGEIQKKHWKKTAVETCEAGLQDPDCHLIFHYDLQKRITKLEKKLRVPKRLQHDFGHVRLADPVELTVEGIQLKREAVIKPGRLAASTKTVWLDELGTGEERSVEDMCLSHFRTEGWKGYHAEGGIVRTIFAYLFYDILFLFIPNVFQTAYQTCPLDLHTDSFFPARASEIYRRLAEISNGEGERLVREVWARHRERRTSVVGLNWDFDIDDIAELVSCFEGGALAAVCKVMAQEYKQRGGGIPDLVLWRRRPEGEGDKEEGKDTERCPAHPGRARGEMMFAEVKSANDRLSDTQRLWIHVLTGAGVRVALCNAVAKEVREVD
ncbi:hypothetical protein N3K66_007324 [Trichothecium roseum]|uniref:Uncharacterized protein n=1 Tax=Trichothecium roseum TaxID=47278 RepID=A0ACC0UTP2_9HYPO|nr:hypothetical protein N3K66_007324 [Trichothecium roseum]